MPLSSSARRHRLERIAGATGGLSMVAMDQRESLRTMFHQSSGETVSDALLSDFKLAVAQVLSPQASAMLLDEEFGREAMPALDPGCGLVVAADRLQQKPGEIVEGTTVDTSLDLTAAPSSSAAALKFLVIWRPDDHPDARIRMGQAFIELCQKHEMLSIVEGVVRAPRTRTNAWDRDDAIVEAARELGALKPDVYKAEVPLHGKGDRREIERRCRVISDLLPCPWVVLSSGVTSEDFPTAVEAACHGGASGFLAGRAIWMDLVGSGDIRARLQEVAVPRLEQLHAIVERCAVPCWEGGS